MTSIPVVAIVSFGIPAAAYGVVTALLVTSTLRSGRAYWLLAATVGTFAWGIVGLALTWTSVAPATRFLVADAAHLMLWAAFAGSLLKHYVANNAKRMGDLFTGASLVLFLVVAVTAVPSFASLISVQLRLILVLCVPLSGLLGLEQVLRNATFEQRPFLKSLTIAIGCIFVINIFVYSEALLFGSIGFMSWSLRGLSVAAVSPLVVLAVKRQPNWGEDLYVSRHVVFYTASLTAAGLYLLAMAGGGYLIGASGMTWSPVLQAAFLVLSWTILLYVLFSRALRTRFRIFLTKHFYRNRYDYRQEWLTLMEVLAGRGSQSGLRERAVRALAGIIESQRGELWLLSRQSDSFVPYGAWHPDRSTDIPPIPDAVVQFVRDTHWVIDTEEYRADPEKYSNAFASTGQFLAEPAILVPLVHDGELVGIVRLARPDGLGQLGFEDHDLLKTAGQQAAIFLIQERDQEELSATRQFEAFTRLTAFLMHDLKNMIAQQELVVGNAKRHKHRPEFVDDAISTMDASVQRMRNLLERLRATDHAENAARVDVGKLVYEVSSACADRVPAPRVLETAEGAIWVSIDREKLAMAVTHAIRNAQDATDTSGHIDVRLKTEGDLAVIEIRDDGVGMDEAFVRDRLFRPFDSTKGAKGMGIGAYQIRETVRAVGGELAVKSELGKGTLLRMTLPVSTRSGARLTNSAA